MLHVVCVTETQKVKKRYLVEATDLTELKKLAEEGLTLMESAGVVQEVCDRSVISSFEVDWGGK